MSFVKRGDPQPIKHTFDSDLKPQVCEECGEPITVLKVGEKENKLICLCNEKDAYDK